MCLSSDRNGPSSTLKYAAGTLGDRFQNQTAFVCSQEKDHSAMDCVSIPGIGFHAWANISSIIDSKGFLE